MSMPPLLPLLAVGWRLASSISQHLVELNDVVRGPALWTVRLTSPVAQGDDRHDGLTFGNVEKLTQFVGIAHSHDKRVEAS